MPTDELDDLAVRLRAGDRTAGDALVEATLRDLRCFLAAHAPDVQLIDEVVQATYLAALEGIDGYHGPGVLRAWLKGIARFQLLRLIDERRRWRRQRGGDALAELEDRAAAELLAAEPVTDDRLAVLPQCLAALPAAQRNLLERHYRDGWSLTRIAEAASATYLAVAKTLSRARQQLRLCIERKAVRP